MRLGTRWAWGAEPPRAVPDVLRSAIADVEASAPIDQFGGPKPSWTLTWLEGKPLAELDSGVVVTVSSTGEAVVLPETPGDDI